MGIKKGQIVNSKKVEDYWKEVWCIKDKDNKIIEKFRTLGAAQRRLPYLEKINIDKLFITKI